MSEDGKDNGEKRRQKGVGSSLWPIWVGEQQTLRAIAGAVARCPLGNSPLAASPLVKGQPVEWEGGGQKAELLGGRREPPVRGREDVATRGIGEGPGQ